MEDVVGADPDGGIVGRHAELQVLAARLQVVESLLDHGGQAGGVNHDGEAVWRQLP